MYRGADIPLYEDELPYEEEEEEETDANMLYK